MQPKRRAIDSQTGIGRKIGGIPKLTTDTLTIADHRGNPTNLRSTGWFEERCFQGSEWSTQVFKLLSDRCESGGDRSQSTENHPDTERTIRIFSLRMTPVNLPYVPILLNEIFIAALWDTEAEKSFISEEVYRRYFFISAASKD
ncbi:uncharacterized protein TNCV_4396171 [Trichonephila clavipes]|uniref:Uncharacterized protein n=1 Tax=Trichonephila clavipes TaxID=2585209 RepID=A0A8X6W4R6_TRICX|nr:uncharacterized protein TNCV_4396171 [Trichonephila clavipes]